METVNLSYCLTFPRVGPLVLSLILAESSLELVPNELNNHSAILSWARRKRKTPAELILDQTTITPPSSGSRIAEQDAAVPTSSIFLCSSPWVPHSVSR